MAEVASRFDDEGGDAEDEQLPQHEVHAETNLVVDLNSHRAMALT